jgi:hypothetical protein
MRKLTEMLAVCLCGIALAAAVSPAIAQSQANPPTQNNLPAAQGKKKHHWACAKDIKNLCPNAKSWKDKRQCLKDNQDNLSSACQKQMKKMRSHFAAFKKACQADVNQFCSAAKGKGPKAIHKCLKQNSDQLSVTCQSFLAKAKAHWKKHHHKSSASQ